MAGKIYLADGLGVIGKEIGAWCANNRAHIFTGLAVTGTITTGVLSARSGARSARKIDRKEQELGRKLTTKEKMALCGKDYILPVAAATVSCIGAVGSDVINTRTIGIQNAALIASEKAYEQLSQKTREVLGEKKAQQVQDEIVKEEAHQPGIITQQKLDEAPRSGNGELHPFYDSFSKKLFWSNLDYINCIIKDLQALMKNMKPRGDEFDYYDKKIGIPYSEWLMALGFEKKDWDCEAFTEFGWNKGFDKDGDDDDPIEYIRTSEEYAPGFAITLLTWEKAPTDMRLGRLLKSNNL